MTFYQREDVYHRFYLEDARKGLILISPTESLVPNALPSRNQLLIVIVERLRIDLAEDEHRKNHGIEKWYQRERSMATIVFRN